MIELRCAKCNRLIGKNVVAGEFKCPKCGAFIVVQQTPSCVITQTPAFVTVDNKPATVV